MSSRPSPVQVYCDLANRTKSRTRARSVRETLPDMPVQKKKKTAYAEAYDSQDHRDTTFRQGRYIVEKSNAVHGQFLIHVAEVSYLSKK